MHLGDLFDIKFKNHAKHQKTILFMVGKVKKFETTAEDNKQLIKEYLELISKYNDLSVCFDLSSFESVNMKSVWEGVSEITHYDETVAKSIKQECIILNNALLITIANQVLQVHKPIFRFGIFPTLKEGVNFLTDGMGNGYQK